MVEGKEGETKFSPQYEQEKHFEVQMSPEDIGQANKRRIKEMTAMKLNMDIQKIKGTMENLVKEITPKNVEYIKELLADYRKTLLYRYAMFKAIVKPRTQEEHKVELENIKNGEFKFM